MKSNKVLLGLFAGVLALIGGAVSAQSVSNLEDSNFVELGPVNIGGHVTSLVVDQHDESHSTVFAGAVSGGLYVRSENKQILQSLYARIGKDASLADNSEIWHYVPYGNGGTDTVIPVSCMVQTPDNSIYIGTGSDERPLGTVFCPMSNLGKGIFVLNPQTFAYTRIAGTQPVSQDDDFAAIRKINYLKQGDTLYLFAVTKGGLYRFKKADNQNWNQASREKVFVSDSVDQFVMARQLRMAYLTIGNRLYMISDVAAPQVSAINISSTNPAFAEGVALKVAVAPSDPTYLYAMVINSNGLMDALYLSRDVQTWNRLTTSTVTPFTRSVVNGSIVVNGDGRRCGTIAVAPDDPEQVYIAGTSVWSGHGYLVNAYYQWTKASYSEQELNQGNYMSSIFGGTSAAARMFVHSGIHQIECAHQNGRFVYYIATDGGVYLTTNGFTSYEKINRGLNNIQVNSVAVCPDGSVISGAHNNACPMIESRTTHDGGTPEVAWYDDGSHGNINHDANILWAGDGNQVAASMFQGIKPQKHRTIFVSSAANQYGRSYADYFDYTNTQTWTIGSSFLSTYIGKGNPIRQLYLWETAEDSIFVDSLTVNIDTLGYVLRLNSTTEEYDTVWMNSSKFQILAGDKMNVTCRAFADYPLEFTFNRPQLSNQRVRVKNPLQARLLAISTHAMFPNYWTVFMSWNATDFSKVWDTDYEADAENQHRWAAVYAVDTTRGEMAHFSRPRAVTMSSDGRAVFVAVYNRQYNKSMIVRVSGFENVNFDGSAKEIFGQLECAQFSVRSRLVTDTLKWDGDSVWIPRAISSLTTDSTDGGDRVVVTFEGFSSDFTNVAFINNATDTSWSLIQDGITGLTDQPALCSMVEGQTGNLYVGTTDGIWVKSSAGWNKYPRLNGVAVTSLVQQKASLALRRHTGHTGINKEYYLTAKTKWPGAIYIGTYGRGIFMDMTYVTDRLNEVSEPQDYIVGVPQVSGNGTSSISIWPNPVINEANLDINASEAGRAYLQVYDLNGRSVLARDLGNLDEGRTSVKLATEGMAKGLYLVNVTIGGRTSAAKMMVR